MAITLKHRLQQPQVLLAPGVYDPLTALIAEQSGFEALYLSGASIAYTRLGRSDIGLTTATEVADCLARISGDRIIAAHRAGGRGSPPGPERWGQGQGSGAGFRGRVQEHGSRAQ